VCEALALRDDVRCTRGMDRSNADQVEEAAWCKAVSVGDSADCSRADARAIECRYIVSAQQDRQRALQAASAQSDASASSSDASSSTTQEDEDGLVEVDENGFVARPNSVEDAFLRRYRRAFPDDKQSDLEVRRRFRAGERFGDDGELAAVEGEAMFELRGKEIRTLMNSDLFSRDLATLGITRERIAWMQSGQCPLSFENPKQYQTFQRELRAVLAKVGLSDATVILTGTSTTFYSENPRKPLGHHFDANQDEVADIDLGVTSAALVMCMKDAQCEPSPKLETIFRRRDTMAQVPEFQTFADRWEGILDRPVNFVAMTSSEAPPVRPSDYVVVRP
jgi:hypothetical protein